LVVSPRPPSLGDQMRMRQSMAQLEREFEHEAILDRERREQLRRQAISRTRVRRRERIEKNQKLRFLMLLASIATTVVVVTWAMFQTLAWLMG
jgi:Flp pilus assembly protein TadB